MIISLPKSDVKWVPFLWVALFTSFFIHFMPGYFILTDTFLCISLLTLPLSFKITTKRPRGRYLYWAVATGILSVPFTSTFGIYCFLVFIILYLIEQYYGRVSFLFAIHLIFISPLFQYLSNLASFPVRLFLSGVSGKLLGYAGFDVEVAGNLIIMDGSEFLVDTACAGLYMLRYSFLFALLILVYFQRQGVAWKKRLLLFMMTVLLTLNMFSNLIRITLLVVFKIMPDNLFHDILGLIIFFSYCLLPFYFVAKRYSKRSDSRISTPKTSLSFSPYANTSLLCCTLALFAFLCWKNGNKLPKDLNFKNSAFASLQPEKINSLVYRISSDKSLIYIKSPVEAYNSDHNPLICWKGSGYEFKQINIQQLKHMRVSVAELAKGEHKLYSMWWFDSGNHQTGSQWEWRWRSLTRKESYYLINITAETPEMLEAEAVALLEKKILMNGEG